MQPRCIPPFLLMLSFSAPFLFPSYFLFYTCPTRYMVKSNTVLVIIVRWRSLLESGRKKPAALINYLQCVGPSSQGTELPAINCQKCWVTTVNDRTITACSVSVSLEAEWLAWGSPPLLLPHFLLSFALPTNSLCPQPLPVPLLPSYWSFSFLLDQSGGLRQQGGITTHLYIMKQMQHKQMEHTFTQLNIPQHKQMNTPSHRKRNQRHNKWTHNQTQKEI